MNSPVAIIILNWNGVNDTIECVGSVLQQDCTEFLIFLADNGSDGNDAEILREKYQYNTNIEIILFTENYGFTKGVNRVVREYILKDNFKYIVLLNNDTIAEKDWLNNLIKSAETNEADIISSKIIDYYQRDKLHTTGLKMLNTGEILSIGRGEDVDLYNESYVPIGACGAASFYRLDMINKIGLFDEYFNTGYEDAEYGLRAFLLGYKIFYEPNALVYHKISASIDKVIDYQYLLKVNLDINYTYLKLMPLPVIVFNSPFYIVRTILLIFFHVLFFRFKYIRLFFHSAYITVFKDIKTIIRKRREFLNCRCISSLAVIKKQEYFFKEDFRRIIKYFIKGEKTIFERY